MYPLLNRFGAQGARLYFICLVLAFVIVALLQLVGTNFQSCARLKLWAQSLLVGRVVTDMNQTVLDSRTFVSCSSGSRRNRNIAFVVFLARDSDKVPIPDRVVEYKLGRFNQAT